MTYPDTERLSIQNPFDILPPHWQFRDRHLVDSAAKNNHYFRVHSFNLPERYVEYARYQQRQGQEAIHDQQAYFFDENGQPYAERSFSLHGYPHIYLNNGGLTKAFNFYSSNQMIARLSNPENTGNNPSFMNDEIMNVCYQDGKLDTIEFSYHFGHGPITSPRMRFNATEHVLKALDQEYFQHGDHYITYECCTIMPDKNSIGSIKSRIFDQSGTPVFSMGYHISEDGKQVIFQQQHRETGITKQIQAPFNLNVEHAQDIASQSFYIDPETGDLVRPSWKDIATHVPINMSISSDL